LPRWMGPAGGGTSAEYEQQVRAPYPAVHRASWLGLHLRILEAACRFTSNRSPYVRTAKLFTSATRQPVSPIPRPSRAARSARPGRPAPVAGGFKPDRADLAGRRDRQRADLALRPSPSVPVRPKGSNAWSVPSNVTCVICQINVPSGAMIALVSVVWLGVKFIK
jgi:hypothetical protein